MRHLILLVFALFSFQIFAQVAKDQVVPIAVTTSTNSVTLTWENPAGFTGTHTVFRRLFNETEWIQKAVVAADKNNYIENEIAEGGAFEYLVTRSVAGSVTALGYVYAGLKKTEIATKGGVILLIDSAFKTSLLTEIDRFKSDLNAEGWYIKTIYAGRNEEVPTIKDRINETVKTMEGTASTLVIIGHVPVPYSGNFTKFGVVPPDGHIEGSGNHTGAWAADVYYGDLDGDWTDNTTNHKDAALDRNDNIVGDGKFDQSKIPSKVELQVGRIDFWEMTAFGKTEEELMRNYFDRNHAFRTAQLQVRHRALIDNNFGSLNLASTGYHNFSTFFEKDSIDDQADYITAQRAGSYLWSYGCGAGSFTSCAGLNNGTARTTDIAAEPLHNIFTILAGSFFGDWDIKDNFLRAPLCNQSLVSFWGGLPKWYVHHMAMGVHLGYGVALSQNNLDNYFNGNFNGSYNSIHIALMGDPTLTMYQVPAPSHLQALSENGQVNLSWNAAQGAVDGYNIYLVDELKNYKRVNTEIIKGTSYTDNSNWYSGEYVYEVRAVKLVQNNSGSFYSISGGSVNGVGATLGVEGSTATKVDHINAVSGIFNTYEPVLYPNPANDLLSIAFAEIPGENMQIAFFDMQGRQVLTLQKSNTNQKNIIDVNISELENGIYLLKLSDGNRKNGIARFVKE